MRNLVASLVAALLFAGAGVPAAVAQNHGPAAPVAGGAHEAGHAGGHDVCHSPPPQGWTFEGAFGTFDRNQLQRGYRVYKEVCASCHGMKLLSFRNLAQPGGPFYDEEYKNPNDNPFVREIIKGPEFNVATIDPETGDETTVPAKPSDRFPSPYANDAQARATHNGALPPDLSVITKARHGGATYIHRLLTGYIAPPDGLTVAQNQYYNRCYVGDTASQWSKDPREAPQGGFLAMAAPLTATGQVEYNDGTEATVDQMAQDVSAFLAWAGDPKAQTRKQMGFAAIAYLLLLAVVVYASYRQIWRNVEH